VKQDFLLLPGLLCDKALWQHQIKALEDTARIQVPELTGYASIQELAQYVLTTAPARFALAGLSMGGYVAMEVMRQAPERVTKLALLDTSARPDTPEQSSKRRGLIELAQKGNFKGVTPRLLPMLIAAQRLKDEALKQTIIDMAARVGMDAFIRQQKAIMGRIDSRPSLQKITVPAVMVCGTEDALTPPDQAEEIASLIPGAKLHLIPGAGHLSCLEAPEEVNKILLDFLN
jgi:pimeloyl-ACP methyl ester carboxylesterase